MYPSLSNEDIEKLVLKDKDGNFIDIKKPIEFLEGDELADENNAQDLAYNNDGEWLVEKEREA